MNGEPSAPSPDERREAPPASAGPPPLPPETALLPSADPPPTRVEVERRERARRVRAETAAWGSLREAIWFFVASLAVNAAGAAYVHITKDTNPRVDTILQIVFVAVVAAFAGRHWREIAPSLRPPQRLGAAALVAFATLVAMGAFVTGWFWVLRNYFEDYEYLRDFRAHDWPLWTAFVLIAVVPPIVEEIGFRGFLMRQLGAVLDRRETLVVQAIVFAAAHCSVAILPSHTVMGIALGWLRQRTGSLLPGMAVHAAWNAIVLLQELARGG